MVLRTGSNCMIDTVELRNRIQAKIDEHLAIVATLQKKLAQVAQVESLANEFGLKGKDDLSHKAATALDANCTTISNRPDSFGTEGSNNVSPPAKQSIPEGPPATKESVFNGNKKVWALMHQGFQTYQIGKPDKALELFREAREFNIDGFEKAWTTMVSLPAYSSLGRDSYFTESLFPKVSTAKVGG